MLQCGENSKKIDNDCETSPQTSETCKYVSESERENQKKAYDEIIAVNKSKKCIPSQIGDLRTYDDRYDKCNPLSGDINDTKCIGEKGANCSYVLPQIAQDQSAKFNEMKQANLQKVCFPSSIEPRDGYKGRDDICKKHSNKISELDCVENQECKYDTKAQENLQKRTYFKKKVCIPKDEYKNYQGNPDPVYYRNIYRTYCKPKSRKPVNDCEDINVNGIKPCKYVEPDEYKRQSNILEGFTNPDKDLSNKPENLNKDSTDICTNKISKSILFGCLFFILSHKKSMNILTKLTGKLSQTNLNLVMMVIFWLLYYTISKLI